MHGIKYDIAAVSPNSFTFQEPIPKDRKLRRNQSETSKKAVTESVREADLFPDVSTKKGNCMFTSKGKVCRSRDQSNWNSVSVDVNDFSFHRVGCWNELWANLAKLHFESKSLWVTIARRDSTNESNIAIPCVGNDPASRTSLC